MGDNEKRESEGDGADDLPVIKTGITRFKSRLDVSQLTMFGFQQSDEDLQNGGKQGGQGGKDGKRKPNSNRNQNQTIIYGADDDDDDVIDDDDYQDQDYDNDDGNLDGGSEGGEEGEDEEEEEGDGYDPAEGYFASDEYDADDLWGDEEGLDDGEGAEDAALLAEQLERERQRQERLAEIREKKESLIERYLKIARIMINNRKKNIYLQDYLFHLASRKGVLRGDPPTTAEDESSNLISKAQKKRQRRKNAIMASRFARFLRKTGHLFDEYGNAQVETHHHHHHRRSRHPNHPEMNSHRLKAQQTKHRHHNVQTTLTIMSKHRIKPCFGRECDNKSKLALINKQNRLKSTMLKKGKSIIATKNKSLRPLTLQERLEKKAAATLKSALKNANEALNEFEKHRCRNAKKKQLIKISRLLEKQYNGVALLDPERSHLVSFVEKSVTAQNLAKRKALRRQNKPEKKGVTNMGHQWMKSLERIRELRLRRAKLEQEHRMQLLRKVKHWHVWEKRALFAVDAVYDFITKMSSHVIMSKKETETFCSGLSQFDKQLHHLHEAMLIQVIKMFKAKSVLCMAQRKVKDSASVLSTKAFTITDYERMIIENQETHDKLLDKQKQLMNEHEKLMKYMKEVAKKHNLKQNSWGALRAGRHDMKALWELCLVERDNLLKKFKELKKVKQFQKRMFIQSAIMENKRCNMDYQRVSHRVDELQDKKRTLQTKVHSVQSSLRVLNVKVIDTVARINLDEEKNLKATKMKKVAQCNATVERRINPPIPQTIHNVNMTNEKSANILQPKNNKGSPRKQKGTRQNPNSSNNAKNKNATKLPPV
ncbi:unnamed protein product [Orchesella dallaii]|uniref:Uncharacterized protein n=1 Tax=Orchesella dallaii TaxID=48710 RepID=A0ABP1RD85_9HEXA